ncbi:energy transducer TonB [Flavobacterium sp. N1994]|uniref:energy transducer TonB n=1 Tax=Flavobacterium sp. N1994 TaxID=2986827 RepID=UPI002222683E|nr:energy transducer TonB [Flavobacterium sp. N1994]
MNRFCLIMFFVATLFSFTAFAQNEKTYDIQSVDVSPKFMGGPIKYLDEMQKALSSHRKKKISIDWIGFTVEKNGTVLDISASNEQGQLSPENNAFLKKISKKWQPALVNGKPVRCSAYASRYPVKMLGTPTPADESKSDSINNEEKEEDNTIMTKSLLDVVPEFPEGEQKLRDFFNDNFKIPEGGKVPSRVVVSFVVEKDGSLTDIASGPHPNEKFREEAVRVMGNCPKWKPGQLEGKNVRTLLVMVFTIKAPAEEKK